MSDLSESQKRDKAKVECPACCRYIGERPVYGKIFSLMDGSGRQGFTCPPERTGCGRRLIRDREGEPWRLDDEE